MKRQITLLICLLFTCVLSAFGQAGWQWGRNNTGPSMESAQAAADPFGNVFAAGMNMYGNATFGSYTISNPTAGCCDAQCVIAKYDNSGNVLWAKGAMAGSSQPVSITTDPSGNLVLLGILYAHISIDTFNLYPVGVSTSYFLAKFDPSGNVLWAKTLCKSPAFSNYFLPNVLFLTTGAITTDVTGNVLVTGIFNGASVAMEGTTLYNADVSGRTSDIFVARFDPSGNNIWATVIGGTNNDYALGITVASSGNVFVAGSFSSDSIHLGSITLTNNVDTQKAFIAEFTRAGIPFWGMTGGGRNGAFCSGIVSDIENNIYIAGSFADSSITFDTTTINRIYNASIPQLETYVAKIAPDHSISWHRNIGSPSNGMACYSLARGYAKMDNLWVAGSWDSTLLNGLISDSANIAGNIIYTPDSSYDPLFIAGFDLYGNLVGYAALQSGGDDQFGIACSPGGNVFLCSDYDATEGFSNFIIGPDTLFNDTSTYNAEKMFVAKYSLFPERIGTVLNKNSTVSVFPNPTDNTLTISGYDAACNHFSISNTLGQVLIEQKTTAISTIVDVSGLLPGIYFFSLQSNGIKVVKEFEKL